MAPSHAGHAMGLDEAMIVAGIGCRQGATREAILAAIDAALVHHGLMRGDLGLLATGELKHAEAGLIAASAALDIPLMLIDDSRLQAVAARCLTNSPASLRATGLPSLSETAALVAVGNDGTLFGPRLIFDRVTCALGTAETATRKDTP